MRHGKTFLSTFVGLAALLFGVASPSHGEIQRADNRLKAAAIIAEAMDIPAADICSCIPAAGETCKNLPPGCPKYSTAGTSPLRGKGIATAPVGFRFPREGGTFALL
jgi:hypothetical protein